MRILISSLFRVQRDEVSLHKKLRTEVIQLEDTLAQVRKEYEMLRIEFEQTLAANEQAGVVVSAPPCSLAAAHASLERQRSYQDSLVLTGVQKSQRT